MKTSRSSRLFTRAQAVLPGGVDSPVRAFKSVGAAPLFIARAAGARIQDVDGNTFVDYVMSWGPLIHGHAPKGLVKALTAVAKHGTSFGAPSPLEVALGEKVRALMPSLERVRFVSSGTEAAMSAVRVARAATGRDRIVKFEGCYHGHADAFLVKAGSGALTLGTPTSPGVTAAASADTLVASYNDLASVHALFDANRDRIAAVIVEPIAGNMGLVPPADGFLRALREVCTASGALLIFDEVISGFRAAAGGAQAIYDVRPDLTCLGKIIGGGLPVGAYGGRADLMDLVSPAGPVYQAGTLSGNPLAMTAGLWCLDNVSAKLYATLAGLGARLAGGLADAARGAGVALQVNAQGSLLTPFFTARPVRDFASATSANTAHYATFFRGMIARGVYPPPSQFEAWFLSAAHTARDVDKTIRAARDAMQDVARGE
jgi:glutamate-1-semialdehyde 2,1-aminomutase